MVIFLAVITEFEPVALSPLNLDESSDDQRVGVISSSSIVLTTVTNDSDGNDRKTMIQL